MGVTEAKHNFNSRRSILALGAATIMSLIPRALRMFVESPSVASTPVTASLKLVLPNGYSFARFEDENPTWVDVQKFRTYSSGFMEQGRLLGWSKETTDSAVEYRFQFKTRSDFEAFFRVVRDEKLVDFEKRSSLGIVANLRVNDGIVRVS